MEIALFAFSVVAADRFIQNAILSSTEWSLTEKTRFTKTKLDLPPCSSKGKDAGHFSFSYPTSLFDTPWTPIGGGAYQVSASAED